MYFRTYEQWENKSPIFKIFDEQNDPCHRWFAVSCDNEDFLYHLHLVPNEGYSTKEDNVILCDPVRALEVLIEGPGSTLNLQVSAHRNNGEPGLYRVVAVYLDKEKITGIAECADGKLFLLKTGISENDINLREVKKELLWSVHLTEEQMKE
jgi:hypothetical protein